MTPFLFGSSSSPLFGVHHAPSRAARTVGAIIVPPFGPEALRAHRALRQLAIGLSQQGLHTLRFDLSHTGDSSGAFEDASIDLWVSDVCVAADELRDRTGVSRVSIIGLRLGALLAWRATRGRRDIDKLLLWEPVVNGAAYMADLERRNEEFLRAEIPRRSGPVPTDEVLGFPVSSALRASIMELDLSSERPPAARYVLTLVATERDDELRLASALSASHANTAYRCVTNARDWNTEEVANSSLVPVEAMTAILAAFEGP